MPNEQLVAAGTGIRAAGQFSLEALASIGSADKALYVVSDPVAEQIIRNLNPAGAESLLSCYRENEPRVHAYARMVEIILRYLRAGERVCFAVYGHPGVFVSPTHEAVRRARAEGFSARILPAISAEDCLFADLGIDPACGWQSLEAGDYLTNPRRLDPFSHVLLWQIGGLGDATFKTQAYDVRGMGQLAGKLMTEYAAQHVVYLYEAAQSAAEGPSIRPGPLAWLAHAPISPNDTLYIPPAAQTGHRNPPPARFFHA